LALASNVFVWEPVSFLHEMELLRTWLLKPQFVALEIAFLAVCNKRVN